jgi:pimeloyl-ACP methyl ester carboxylesterase
MNIILQKPNEGKDPITNDDLQIEPLPPIVMLGGMAQTIESLQHHFQEFSRERDLLVYEYLGQGFSNIEDGENSEDYSNLSMELHSDDFKQISNALFPYCKKFDVVAFSLGARIIVSTIASYPHLIRKAHLTGISDKRDEFGKIILASWRDLLHPIDTNDHNDLLPFAWSIILATYSNDFISKMGVEKTQTWVDFICKNNTRSGLYSLLTKCNCDPIEYSTSIRLNSQTIGQIAVGSQDKIAPYKGAEKLNNSIGWTNPVKVYDAGHAVLNENSARDWRKDVIDFLKG